MKKTFIIAMAWPAIFILSSPGISQVEIVPDQIAAFNTLLRDLDLNEATQDGYAITTAEYEQLKTAWQGLSQSDKHQLLTGVDLLHKGSPMFRNDKLRIAEEIKTEAKRRTGSEARRRLEEWEQLINACQNHSDMDKIRAVNEYFNRQITMKADKGSAKGCDYWQSPIETLVRGIGDCDDFAMAKYVSLRLLGIPVGQLRVAVVKGNFSYKHAVLFFFSQAEKDPWVLDNLTFEYLGDTDSHILRLSERMIRHQIKPICGINENELTEFREGLNEITMNINPRYSSPQFGTALMNSQSVLPPERG